MQNGSKLVSDTSNILQGIISVSYTHLDVYKRQIDGNNYDSIRAFLICSSGETFCAGNDIGDFINNGIDFANSPQKKFFDSLSLCEKPIVSAVQGKAVGIGTTMLLHFDINYAADNAQFSTPFVNLGLVPEGGSSLILPMKIGHQRSVETVSYTHLDVYKRQLQQYVQGFRFDL